MKNLSAWPLAAIVLLVGVLAGCDSAGEDAGDNARLSVVLTDAPFPFDLVERAEVTISGVEVESDAEGRVELSDDVVTLNLLDLAGGVTALLADDIVIPPGVYNKILLNVTNASVELTDGQTFDVTVPSGRIQVLVGAHELDAGESATAVLDFDVSQSFVVQGNPDTPAGIKGFNFKPVVRSLGFLKRDDDDRRAELQGAIDVLGADFIEIGGNRFFIDANTEIDGGFGALTEGMVVEVEFFERADGTLIATEIEIEGNGDDDVHETSGVVSGIDTIDGAVHVTVGELTFRVVPGVTEFDGIAGVEGLIIGETEVEIDYYVDAETGDLIAAEIEKEEND